MSSAYNQGPIVSIAKSNSQKSLYSNQDHDIDSPIRDKNPLKNNTNNQNFKQTLNHQIKQNNNFDKNIQKQTNHAIQNQEIQDQSNRDKNQQKLKQSKEKDKQLRHSYRNYNQILSETNNQKNVDSYRVSREGSNRRYFNQAYNQKSPRDLLKFQQPNKQIPQQNNHYEPNIDFLKSQTNSRYQQFKTVEVPQNEQFKQRALRSSQGGRWIRSQNLMQKKQKTSVQYLIRNYHKHESKYSTQVNNYLNILTNMEVGMSKKPYSFSIFNSLDQIKKKIEEYLQKNLMLQNLPIDKPTIDWTQSELTQFFTKYEPIYVNPNTIDSKSKLITLKKYKNCVYFGSMNNGKKDGAGVVYYYSGKIFQGTFQNDQKIQGVEIDSQMNQIYVGSFKKGVRSGEGLLKTNEYLFAGTFNNNQFEQNASFNHIPLESKFPSLYQTKNSNQFQNNKSLKQGIKISFSTLTIYTQSLVINKNSVNDIYIGNYNSSQQKFGQGLQIFANGDIYIGKYENDIPQGYGQYYWSSGAYYRGNFMSGMRHGKGKWHMVHGDFYQGEYMNDKKNGKGTYLWKNGSKYVGSFQNDYRHGYGQMTWNDGRSYKGDWLNGIQKNVTIKLDKGSNSSVPSQVAKAHHYLPGVTKNSFGKTAKSNSFSHKTTKNQGTTKKKIPLQNLKSLYNPSNY